MRFLSLIACMFFTCVSPLSASAQQGERVSMFHLRIYHNKGIEGVALQNSADIETVIERYNGPEEPVIQPVEFHVFEKPSHIQGQVEALMHGITIGLPAEYDHYGYELRRYMRSVGNFDIYKNSADLEKQRLNIKIS